MSFHSWLQDLRSALVTSRSPRRRPRAATHRPRLEVLEVRTVPSGYKQMNLVGYEPGMGRSTDPNLNGWGMTSLPDGSFVVANAFTTGLATFYDRHGHVLPLTITVPGSAAGSAALGLGPGGHPTGVVYNPTSDFVISEGCKSAPALLIFDSIDGTLSGWNPAVDPTHALLIPGWDTFAAGDPGVFTGLEIAQNRRGQNVLYAADFLNNRVDMIDGNFNLVGTFMDPTVKNIDPNLGVWSVQAQSGKLYVTFADLHSFNAGAVDVFDTDGILLRHFAANGPGAGPLENPWGITQAPANFGAYSNDILIGNVAGAGNINVFDPHTGAYLGQLGEPNGTPIAIKGLWDLEFGDGTPDGGRTNQLYFDAGPNHPGDSTGGLFGVIRAARHQDGDGDGGPSREAAGVRRLLRASDSGGSGVSSALPNGVQAPGSGAVPGGVQAQPATSPGPAAAAGSNQAVALVSTPAGPTPGVLDYRIRDQAFADLERSLSVTLAPMADPPWTW